MWTVSSNNITMVEGDFGISLPIVVSGITFASGDEIKLSILKKINGGIEIVGKTFTNIQNNTINLELTEQESSLLHAGTYVYRLDWYQNGVFMCNIIPSAPFKVVEKA